MQNVVQLDHHQLLVERPFTDPDHIESDSATLLTAAKNAWRIADQAALSSGVNTPSTIYYPEPDLWQKRTMLLSPTAMMTATSLTVVGFFGNKRAFVDAETEASVVDAGKKLCAALYDQPSIVCYVTKLLADAHNYTNLVVMNSDQTVEEWRKNEVHKWVTAEISPHYYNNVRIYSGILSISHQPLLLSLDLHRVKYFDYTGQETWYGVRQLSESTPDASTSGAPTSTTSTSTASAARRIGKEYLQ